MTSMYELLYGRGAGLGPVNQTRGYNALQQPIAPELQEIMTPATSPEEVEARKQGWMQVLERLKANPNASRAMAFMGAQMLQPRPAGQSHGGQFANAYLTGRNAYEFGEEQELQRALALVREGRAQEAHEVNVESARAGTEGTRARTEATKIETDVSRQTVQDRVRKVKTEAEAAALALSKAKSQEEVDAVKREYEKKRNELLAGVPDATLRQSIEDELKKQGVENRLREAQAASASATAGYYGSKAGEQTLENKDLQAMTPEERAQYRTRTGKFGGAGGAAATVAGETVFGRLFEQQNPKPAEPEKQAEWTAKRAKYVEERLTKLRQMDGDKQRIEAYKLWQIDGGADSGKSFSQFAAELGLSFTTTPQDGRPGNSSKYQVGKIYKGKSGDYRYKGGDDKDPNNWEKVK